jgi:hypothetical protein
MKYLRYNTIINVIATEDPSSTKDYLRLVLGDLQVGIEEKEGEEPRDHRYIFHHVPDKVLRQLDSQSVAAGKDALTSLDMCSVNLEVKNFCPSRVRRIRMIFTLFKIVLF